MTVANLKVLLSELSLQSQARKLTSLKESQNQSPDTIDVEPSPSKEIDDLNQDPTREDIETVVSNMVEGRIANEESEITLQTIVLIGVVVLALGLVVLFKIPSRSYCLEPLCFRRLQAQPMGLVCFRGFGLWSPYDSRKPLATSMQPRFSFS